MGDYTERTHGTNQDEGKIDLNIFLEEIVHALRRVWWVIILLTIVFGAAFYLRVKTSYVPKFEAEATLSINAVKSDNVFDSENPTNIATAQQLGKVFPYILTSGVLSDMVARDLESEYVPGTISVEAVENTNLVTIKVEAQDGQTAYDILQSVIKNYPEVAQFVIGQTEISILDDSGVPEDTGSEYVARGSVKQGALVGFLVGIAILFLYMITHRTIRYPGDFKAMLNIPCVGVIPQYRKKKRRKKTKQNINIMNKNISQEYLESIRSVRTRVERSMENEQKKTIMITSSVPGEGKSTVAANLAISFAQKGKRVILVDCDLRNPSIQSTLDIKGKFPGVQAVLNGEAELKEALYSVPGKDIDLQVMCGSYKSSQSVEILGGDEMNKLLQKLESMADVVILDTSPSAMLVDAIMMARHVSLALYIVKYDYAKVAHILEGIEELSETGIQIVGCVLNEGKYGTHGAGYGYRYGKYNYGYGYARSRYYGRDVKRN